MKTINLRRVLGGLAVAVISVSLLTGCDLNSTPQSSSGVTKHTVKVPVGPDGLTVEQRAVAKRLDRDNQPGSLKHFYTISPFSGDVLIYSTVQNKVTSSGKRLTPKTVTSTNPFRLQIAGETVYTTEVLEDDGTYGESVPYIFWFDAADRYHQHFFTGGQIIHVTDAPISVPKVTINMEVNQQKPDGK